MQVWTEGYRAGVAAERARLAEKVRALRTFEAYEPFDGELVPLDAIDRAAVLALIEEPPQTAQEDWRRQAAESMRADMRGDYEG